MRETIRGKFYWWPVFMNCITARKGDPKIYRWGWWNFTWGEVENEE